MVYNIYGTHNNTPEQLEEYINQRRKELGIDIPFSIEEYRKGSILKPNDVQIEHITGNEATGLCSISIHVSEIENTDEDFCENEYFEEEINYG